MHVALISEHASPLATPGGIGFGSQSIQVAELADALADQGHQVRVYTRRDAGDLPETVRLRDGVQLRHVPAGPAEPLSREALLPHLADFSGWLVDHWRRSRWTPDVIHAHYWTSGLAALTAGRRTGVPVVQSYHDLGVTARRHRVVGTGDPVTGEVDPPRRIGYERVLGRGADLIVAQGQEEVRELIHLGVPRSRMTVVPPGVDQEGFAPEGPVATRHPDRPRVLSVGRLIERKGFQDLVRAMRIVPEAECVVVGAPAAGSLDADPFAERLRRLADSCGVADRVRLVGPVPRAELASWYRSADLVVAAPWYEPFARTSLEAMACGVPVVGTAVGGLADTVVDGLTGDLVPPRDPRALGTAVRRLLREPVRRFSYASAALDRVRNMYSWQRAADRLTTAYAGLLRRPVVAVA